MKIALLKPEDTFGRGVINEVITVANQAVRSDIRTYPIAEGESIQPGDVIGVSNGEAVGGTRGNVMCRPRQQFSFQTAPTRINCRNGDVIWMDSLAILLSRYGGAQYCMKAPTLLQGRYTSAAALTPGKILLVGTSPSRRLLAMVMTVENGRLALGPECDLNVDDAAYGNVGRVDGETAFVLCGTVKISTYYCHGMTVQVSGMQVTRVGFQNIGDLSQDYPHGVLGVAAVSDTRVYLLWRTGGASYYAIANFGKGGGGLAVSGSTMVNRTACLGTLKDGRVVTIRSNGTWYLDTVLQNSVQSVDIGYHTNPAGPIVTEDDRILWYEENSYEYKVKRMDTAGVETLLFSGKMTGDPPAGLNVQMSTPLDGGNFLMHMVLNGHGYSIYSAIAYPDYPLYGHAICIQVEGGQCTAVLDGVVEAPWAKEGMRIESDGVTAYAPKDGVLAVEGCWNAVV